MPHFAYSVQTQGDNKVNHYPPSIVWDWKILPSQLVTNGNHEHITDQPAPCSSMITKARHEDDINYHRYY